MHISFAFLRQLPAVRLVRIAFECHFGVRMHCISAYVPAHPVVYSCVHHRALTGCSMRVWVSKYLLGQAQHGALLHHQHTQGNVEYKEA